MPQKKYDEEVINADIARKIYVLRTKAGLTQQELAERAGTSKSAICRLMKMPTMMGTPFPC